MMIAVPPAVFPDETAPPPKPGVEKDSALDESVRKGLEYLAKSQDPNTGAIGDPSYKLASTSLAGMAFLSGGNLPGRGLYGKNVEMAIRFILNNATSPSGYMQHESSNMYSHGFATLFLAEAYGTVPPYMKLQPKMYKVLKKSIDLIERCQSPEGGWWYNPTKSNAGQGADISVTVCETNALRAARNCGVAVDKRVVENALKCVKGAQNDDGGFSYRTYVERRNDGSSAVPRSAGAVCILQSLGAYTDLETQKGIDYLKRSAVDQKVDMSQLGATYYALYYLSQSMFMSGMKNWNEWWPKVKALLLSKQGPDGGWQGEGGKGYGTAVALIILQMPYRYLPIYQEGIENADNTPAETPAP
jgi:hypothetical protein